MHEKFSLTLDYNLQTLAEIKIQPMNKSTCGQTNLHKYKVYVFELQRAEQLRANPSLCLAH